MRHLLLKYISTIILFLVPGLCAVAGTDSDPFVLVIDPGHGGKDAGAVGRYSKEKDINLKVALAFGRLVEQNCTGVKVVYTRKTDVFIPLQTRADIANKVKADLFISVHTNSLPKGRTAYGTETYTLGMARADENLQVARRENAVITYETNYKQVYQGFDPDKVESYIIFELIQDKNMEQSVEMARCLQNRYTSHAGRRNKGVHQAGFLVLRNTSMPAILTELGFISTPAEENFLNSADGIRKMSYSIYAGFQDYRQKYDKKCGNLPAVNDTAPGSGAADVTSRSPAAPGKEKAAPEKAVLHTSGAGAATAGGRPIFKVQLLACDRLLKETDPRFKGIRPVEHYQEKGWYKYTYGSSADYNEIRRKQKEVAGKLQGTFIVAFLNGKRMNLADAIKMSKRK